VHVPAVDVAKGALADPLNKRVVFFVRFHLVTAGAPAARSRRRSAACLLGLRRASVRAGPAQTRSVGGRGGRRSALPPSLPLSLFAAATRAFSPAAHEGARVGRSARRPGPCAVPRCQESGCPPGRSFTASALLWTPAFRARCHHRPQLGADAGVGRQWRRRCPPVAASRPPRSPCAGRAGCSARSPCASTLAAGGRCVGSRTRSCPLQSRQTATP